MHMKKNILVVSLSVLLLLSLAANFFIGKYYENRYQSKFSHLSPSIAWMKTDEFLSTQSKYAIEFQDLKKEFLNLTNSTTEGIYGIYFEDLNTGAWIGINEREKFITASLLKVPVMVAILKKVERGEISLDQKVTLKEDDLDSMSGTLATKGAGYQLTVRELLTYLIKESDNTAAITLHERFLGDQDIVEAMLAMGLPIEQGENPSYMGPKHYSNILRSLYYSAYMRRTFSELALSIMSDTDYNKGIPAGVPKNIAVSHKIGFVFGEDSIASYHDCGIIYHPVKPYILCVMTKGTSEENSLDIIAKLSESAYVYVDKISK